jgi:putative transposase
MSLMKEWCGHHNVDVWAYCLMPNHVHLIVVPDSEDGLRRAIGEAHRRYTRHINFRKKWRGHLWQGRFASYIMDEYHLLTAVRYVELNPVRARLVKRPEQWAWSSASAHIAGKNDGLVNVAPMIDLVHENWNKYLSTPVPENHLETMRSHERTGRPLGSDDFVSRLEQKLGRALAPQKPGPKKE